MVGGNSFNLILNPNKIPPDRSPISPGAQSVWATLDYRRGHYNAQGEYQRTTNYPDFVTAVYTQEVSRDPSVESARLFWKQTGGRWSISEIHANLHQLFLEKNASGDKFADGQWPAEFPKAVRLDLVNCVPR